LFLLVAIIIPNPSLVGTYGKFIGESTFLLFGYLSYIVPLYLIILEWFFYKEANQLIFERLFAIFILIINLLIIQSLFFKSGLIGNLFIQSLQPLIGVIGIVLLNIGVFVLIGLILKLNIKIPQKKSNQIIKNDINDNIEMPSINKNIEKEDTEAYIKKQMQEVHKIEEDIKEESITSNQISLQKENKSIKEEIKVDKVDENIINDEKNEIVEEIKEEIKKEIISQQPKKEEVSKQEIEVKSEFTEIEEEAKEIEKIEPKITKIKEEKPEIIESKAIIVNELDENKELLNSIETGEIKKPTDFQLPSLNFLTPPPSKTKQVDESEIDAKVNLLLNKLRNFKIDGDVVRTYTGPVVTTFEFKPLAHIKVSKILNLADDLSMALKASTIRIQAPVPGKDVVGIEIPNKEIDTIYLREILESEIFKKAKSPLVIALGKDIVGKPFVTDLAKLPHVLIAGTTGSGKSVGINAMILSLLYRNSPDDLKLMMIDPKMLEFSIYNEIPHLLTPVITDPKKAMVGLDNMVKEMERRYHLMSKAKVKNIENFNAKFPDEKLPYIVVIIDELADLMMMVGKEVELSIARLAQKARASGIHLIVATQRPSVDVVTGLIKANLPSRISYKVGQKIDSKVILDQLGAESLLGRGDMLFTPGSGAIVRLHAPLTTEEEIEEIVEFLKSQRMVDYDENFLSESVENDNVDIVDKDELFEDAKQIIINEGKTSISYLQRRLQIGYNRAANIIEQLELSGFLSAPNSKGQREILA